MIRVNWNYYNRLKRDEDPPRDTKNTHVITRGSVVLFCRVAHLLNYYLRGKLPSARMFPFRMSYHIVRKPFFLIWWEIDASDGFGSLITAWQNLITH